MTMTLGIITENGQVRERTFDGLEDGMRGLAALLGVDLGEPGPDLEALSARHEAARRRAYHASTAAWNAQRLHSAHAPALRDLARRRAGEAVSCKDALRDAWQQAGRCLRCGEEKTHGGLCRDCREDLGN